MRGPPKRNEAVSLIGELQYIKYITLTKNAVAKLNMGVGVTKAPTYAPEIGVMFRF